MVTPEGMKSLYIHIPFCKWVCHYCDFAKSANFDDQVKQSYLDWLLTELTSWLAKYSPRLESVFFGGGTPSIFAREYEPIMSLLARYLQPNAEISLEANPDDINPESLAVWSNLGFNRISLGIQTFDKKGIEFLTRKHSPEEAQKAIEGALYRFGNVNIDLIYGWPTQSSDSWQNDLAIAAQLGIPHLSLYCLTFEPRTVIGRRFLRGKVIPPHDEELFLRYEEARAFLASRNYLHEEVSNWCMEGFSCVHNWAYWQDAYYLGVGTGAHGYLPDEVNPIGKRYYYPSTSLGLRKGTSPIFEERTVDQWRLEYLGSALRTSQGVSLDLLNDKAHLTLTPTGIVERGLSSGALFISSGVLRLDPSEWFREAAWATAIDGCLKAAN